MSQRSSVTDHASSGKRKRSRVDPRVPIYDDKTGERVNGVRKTRTGERYECKIYHPITFKDIWVGTFDTVQEASEAYQARKKQLLESCRGGLICGEFDSNSRVIDEKTGVRITGVWTTRKGDRYDTKIYDPITRRDVWIGTFDTIQQASEAYNAKKKEFDQVSVRGGRHRGRNVVDKKATSEEKIPKKYVTKIFHPSTSNHGCVRILDHVEVLVKKESESNGKTQKTSESSSEATQQPLNSSLDRKGAMKMAPDKSSKELVSRMVYNFEDLQKKSVRVTKGGGESSMPFRDNYGFLLGEFSKLDGFLSLRLGTGNSSSS